MTQRWLLASVWLALTAAPLAADEWRRVSQTALHMGVEFEAVVYARDAAAADKALTAALARVGALDAVLSDYRPESQVSQVSEKAGQPQPVSVGDDLLRVLQAAHRVSEQSGGAFDVTAGALTKLWRRARRLKEYPSAENLQAALATVGFRELELSREQKTVRLIRPGARLDLGGIAKGYAADEALAVLVQAGFPHALVRASGDIAVHDPPPGECGWRIAVAPLDPEAPPQHFLRLARQAVSTSGEARQHFVHAGQRYSHLVNPHTGVALTGRMSVTVVSRRGTDADALASAVAVLGPQAGLKLLSAWPGTEAYLLTADDRGEQVQAQRTPGFVRLCEAAP